jgi:hypothetical protein
MGDGAGCVWQLNMPDPLRVTHELPTSHSASRVAVRDHGTTRSRAHAERGEQRKTKRKESHAIGHDAQFS